MRDNSMGGFGELELAVELLLQSILHCLCGRGNGNERHFILRKPQSAVHADCCYASLLLTQEGYFSLYKEKPASSVWGRDFLWLFLFYNAENVGLSAYR